MSLNPDVTVILTSYNHEQFIGSAIESVLDQTYKNFELIIIDDCSSDRSWDIISSFEDPRIIKIRYDVRCRGAHWINENIKHRARGRYISIHHSDDLHHHEKIEKQLNFLENHSEIGAVFSNVSVIDESGELLKDKTHIYYSIFKQQNRSRYAWLQQFFFHGNCLCHPSILIRKECYENAGLYNPYYGSLPDFDMWVRLCLKYDIHIMDDELVFFRVFSSNLNTSAPKPETFSRSYNEYRQICRNYLNIMTVEELKKVFPGLVKLGSDETELIPYELARIALNSEHNRAVLRDFGLSMIYELIIQRDHKYVQQILGFDFLELIEKSGEIDIQNFSKIAEYQHEILHLKDRLACSEKQNNDLITSFSWRLTAPLRKMHTFVKSI